MNRLFFLFYIVMTTGAANAREMCADYVGKTVAVTSIEAAISRFANLTPKSEFETTAQFRARRVAELSGASSPLVVGKRPEDRSFFQYDADRGVLRIQRFAFHNTTIDLWSAFYSAGMDKRIEVSTIENIYVVIEVSDKAVGSYEATNAYGAKIEVAKIQRKSTAIFDREISPDQGGLFPSAEVKPYVVGELVLSPAEAQRLKPQLKLAFVVTPKEPYTVVGSHKAGNTTVRNPRDITEDFSVLIADIQCGLVMDGANNVLGAYHTRRFPELKRTFE